MDIYLAAIVLLGLLFTRAEAQGVSIHMHSGEGYAADGVLFEPASGQSPFPAILLIPDERGLTQRVTDTAQDLSAAGYFVTVVDLNRGQAADVAEHSAEQALHDLDAALAFLSKQSRVRQECLGVLGWQSGGLYALKLAAANAKICAVVVRGAALPPDSAKLRAKVMVGSDDQLARTLMFFKTALQGRIRSTARGGSQTQPAE